MAILITNQIAPLVNFDAQLVLQEKLGQKKTPRNRGVFYNIIMD